MRSPSLKSKDGSGLADVRVTFRNLQNQFLSPNNGLRSTPVRLENLLDDCSEALEDTSAKMTNLDKKHTVDGFLQRQAEAIENVKATTKSRSHFKSERTDFAKHVASPSAKFDQVKSKIGAGQQAVKLTEAQA